jgi:hypothetical protein
MTQHIRILAILQIVYASLGILLGVGVFLLFGGIAGIVGISADSPDSLVAIPILAVIGGLASSVIIALSLPRLIAGMALYQFRNWGRILTLVVGVIGLLDFPIGTGLGIYALWVLTHRDAGPLFDAEPRLVNRAAAR